MNPGNQSFSDQRAAENFPENLVILSHNEFYQLPLMQIQDNDVDYNLKHSFWERFHT